MWNSRPPLHGKIHLKFPFWLLEDLPKDFSIYPNRKLNITPHRSYPQFTFFFITLQWIPVQICTFSFRHFSPEKLLLPQQWFLSSFGKFFLQECPFLKESFFRLERSKLMKIDFFSNRSEYVFKFIHWRAGWQNLANWIITESHTGVRLLMYLSDATVSPH